MGWKGFKKSLKKIFCCFNIFCCKQKTSTEENKDLWQIDGVNDLLSPIEESQSVGQIEGGNTSLSPIEESQSLGQIEGGNTSLSSVEENKTLGQIEGGNISLSPVEESQSLGQIEGGNISLSPAQEELGQIDGENTSLNQEEIPVASSNPEERFDGVELIGEGAFGKVYQCRLRDRNLDVAVKVVEVEEDERESQLQEIYILRKLSHKNVVLCYDACIYNTDMETEELWITMELCGGGSLHEIMNNHFELYERYLPEHWIQYIVKEILQGLLYLHKRAIIHRDIKPDNIIFTEDAQVKLADFGVALQLDSEEDTTEDCSGSMYYFAPEVHDCSFGKNNGYNAKSDIWSLGFTIIEIAEGMRPFSEYSMLELSLVVSSMDQPELKSDSWSNEFRSFLNMCLLKDPEYRAAAKDLLKHKFITEQQPASSAQMEIAELIKENNPIEEPEEEKKENEHQDEDKDEDKDEDTNEEINDEDKDKDKDEDKVEASEQSEKMQHLCQNQEVLERIAKLEEKIARLEAICSKMLKE